MKKTTTRGKEPQIAVLIPCYNEELTVAKVVGDFRTALPKATIYVYDNNSSDRTAELARKAGAVLRHEWRQGKGHVVRSMFRQIEADYYIMVDGDDTYPAESAEQMLAPLLEDRADMVCGDRLSGGGYRAENKRPFHDFGNHLVRRMINLLFGSNLLDIMTGYRAFTRDFVKNFPITSGGFEIETEMSLHALDKRFRIAEVDIDYRDRPPGSHSKLNTFRDGFRVLRTIFWLFKDYKPLLFFTLLSVVFFLSGVAVGIPVILDYLATGLVPRYPSAILASGLMVISVISLFSGFILDTIVKHHRSNYELLLLKSNDRSS